MRENDRERRSHPSGRPMRSREPRRLSIMRNPGIGPYTERLRRPEAKDAIGFHHVHSHEGEEED